jgi:hypothetical protein
MLKFMGLIKILSAESLFKLLKIFQVVQASKLIIKRYNQKSYGKNYFQLINKNSLWQQELKQKKQI